jgi:hypothetical protein
MSTEHGLQANLDAFSFAWTGGLDKEFLLHLINIHTDIKFVMEIEPNGSLPFLCVLVTGWKDH